MVGECRGCVHARATGVHRMDVVESRPAAEGTEAVWALKMEIDGHETRSRIKRQERTRQASRSIRYWMEFVVSIQEAHATIPFPLFGNMLEIQKNQHIVHLLALPDNNHQCFPLMGAGPSIPR